MICKGNFDGELVNGNNGEVEQFEGYGVIICEDVNEWSALSEAIRYYIMHLKKITRPEPEVWNFSEEIKILQKMYNEFA